MRSNLQLISGFAMPCILCGGIDKIFLEATSFECVGAIMSLNRRFLLFALHVSHFLKPHKIASTG